VPPTLLTDNPITGAAGDEFGFREHADLLCEALAATTDLPLTLAVFGPWGSGKSSFLNICRDLLDAWGMTAITFSPWKYDKRDEVWHALLQTLLNELVRQAAESPEPTVRERVRAILGRVARLSVSASWLVARQLISTATGSLVSVADLEGLKEQLLDEPESTLPGGIYESVNRFEKDFADVVRALTGERPVVVFIDDLDRCRRDTALSVLEALRIFTGDAPCIFVIAMDQAALVDAAAAHFDGDRTRGRWYLEKLVHFSYHLPAVRYESLCHSLRPKLAYLQQDPVLWEVVRVAFDNNPRRVRRFISGFNLTMTMLARTGAQSLDRMRQVAILLMLRQEHPECFAALSGDPKLWERLAEATTDEQGTPLLAQRADQDLVVRDPRLFATIRAIARTGSGFTFPPPPSADLLLLLTEVLVVGTLTADGGGA
jgi:hypothetical protein